MDMKSLHKSRHVLDCRCLILFLIYPENHWFYDVNRSICNNYLIQSFVIMNIKKQRADILNLTRCDKSIIY